MLDPIRRGIPMDFGHLPPVFALDGTQQAPEIRPRPATGFAARKTGHDAAFYLGLPDGPGTHHLQGQVWGWCAQLLPSLHGSVLHKVLGTMIAKVLGTMIAYDLQL